MKRVAIYARYSSELSNDSSIEDQIRVCEAIANREGWTVVEHYIDRAISGTTIMKRPGICSLMEDAEAGGFDIVLSEALDRLSRDQADIAQIHKDLEFLDIKIHTKSEGEIGILHVGLKGTMNHIFINDLSDKVKRGQQGRAISGKIAAGRAYGYNVVRGFDAQGNLITGEREINKHQAEVVRRIYREYAGGKSPAKIAAGLNADGIKSPTGKDWNQSTINGRKIAGLGILNNSIYVGKYVWNRVPEKRNRRTGKIKRKLNSESEWTTCEIPHLQIVDNDLWNAVKQQQKKVCHGSKGFWKGKRPKYLLSGLLVCGECDGKFTKADKYVYGCSTRKHKGTCKNHLKIKKSDIEASVIHAVQKQLMNQKALEIFCEEYTSQLDCLQKKNNSKTIELKKDLANLDKRRTNIVDAIGNGSFSREAQDVLNEDLNKIVERRNEIESILEGIEEAPELLPPSMSQNFARGISEMVEALNDEDLKQEAISAFQTIIEKIVLTPNQDRTHLQVDLYGQLAGILSIAENSAISEAEGNLPSPFLKLVVLAVAPAPLSARISLLNRVKTGNISKTRRFLRNWADFRK